MKKKILPLVTAGFLAMGLFFSLASCSQEGDTNNYEKFFTNDDLIAVLQELFPDTY